MKTQNRGVILLGLTAVSAMTLSACNRPGAQANRYPAEVRQWETSAGEECRKVGGRFDGVANHVVTGDFNGDGKTDYLMRWDGVKCVKPGGGNQSAFNWGPAGPDNDFLISEGETFRMVEGFQGSVEQGDVTRRGQADVITVQNEEPDAPVRRQIWGFNDGKIEVIERQGEDGGLVTDGGRPINQPANG